ncbi:DUF1553 domain-containing protein [Planctomicrobium sp. SH527]|uniref:PSD1 and planctomycete cytochrome C domain-containing protein n=1 Tax=Planctomicrobium sp. SH527 TaxID=3448123 RepID=UPI003F5CAD78
MQPFFTRILPLRFLTPFVGVSLGLSSVVSPAALPGVASAAEVSDEDLKFFENKIRPILIERCADCHGADSQESGLRMDTYSAMLSGGTSGPAVVPGKIDESLMIAAIEFKDTSLQMPPDGKMPTAEIELLKEWVKRGAPHPEKNSSPGVQPRRSAIDLDEAKKYWAFQPIAKPPVPAVENKDWSRNPIDAFQFSLLKQQGLTPVAPADKQTLIRRATFDLIGLPPTPEEIQNFVADTSADAFEKVIDRLLASPQYGERWGRHWLDVARYADSNGLDENVVHIDAWKYRDYVVSSFNADKPFDRFVTEQLAGDILHKQKVDAGTATDDDLYLLIATGYMSVGAKVLAEPDPMKMEMDIIDEQIDTIGQSLLGLTLACARCHDHKFDPISTADYYALAGILKSTKTMTSHKIVAKWNEHVVAPAADVKAKAERDAVIAAKQKEIDDLVKASNAEVLKQMGAAEGAAVPKDAESKYPAETKKQLADFRAELKALKDANPELPTAMGVVDGATLSDVRIHVRGSHQTLGRSVARGVPEVLAPENPVAIPETTSGRLQFAEWVVKPTNPLTARVAVNRMWRWHFGQGLVGTTDNFGELGTRPANPQLLDWLAAHFIESGWSFKTMHKAIMLSNTYQMSTATHVANSAIDPDNQFQWRAKVQRLEAEQIRDALLAVSGSLDTTMGGTLITLKKWEMVFNHTSKDGTGYDTNRRSIYLPVIRNNLYDAFSLFDYSTADVPVGSRETSTVAPQALFMMNSPLVIDVAEALTDRLIRERPEENARIQRFYELAFGRSPTEVEQQRILSYVKRLERELITQGAEYDPHRAAWIAAIQSLLSSNEFVYVN